MQSISGQRPRMSGLDPPSSANLRLLAAFHCIHALSLALSLCRTAVSCASPCRVSFSLLQRDWRKGDLYAKIHSVSLDKDAHQLPTAEAEAVEPRGLSATDLEAATTGSSVKSEPQLAPPQATEVAQAVAAPLQSAQAAAPAHRARNLRPRHARRRSPMDAPTAGTRRSGPHEFWTTLNECARESPFISYLA